MTGSLVDTVFVPNASTLSQTVPFVSRWSIVVSVEPCDVEDVETTSGLPLT